MIQIPGKSHPRKSPSFKILGPDLKWLSSILILIVGMGIGSLLTQQALLPDQKPWLAPAVQDVPAKVCFTPDSQCTSGIVEAIESAKSSVYVQAYFFTSEPIANALVEVKNRGVDVRVILDKSQTAAKGSQLNKLLKANIPIFIDYVLRIAHNKVMIIDDTYVLTGSFNFTEAADTRNAENVLLLQSPELARLYKANWNARQQQSRCYP